MAFTDRGRVVWKQGQGSRDRTRELLAGMLLGALIATLGLRNMLPTDALAPAVTTLLFALGAATAAAALLCRRNQARTAWIEIAGLLTFVGVAVSILIEPDQMVRLVTTSDQLADRINRSGSSTAP
jgi:hypothetical protein